MSSKSTQSVDPDRVVLVADREEDLDEVKEKLEGLGTVEARETIQKKFVAIVKPRKEKLESHWKQIAEALGDKIKVLPLFVDPEGNQTIPTGEVTVRFKESPSDEELASCAKAWGVKVAARNKYVASQVTFEPAGKPQYLPNLLKGIESKATLVERAWANTASRYKRGK